MHLPVGSMLGEYCITGVIGQGGFSIVYLAYEASLDRTIAIKEFFPTVLAQRSAGHSVAVVSSSNQPIFKVGLESFLREAKLQAKFFHPALVEVIRVWEQNNSAYIAMRYHRGQNLRDMKRSGMDLSAEQILSFVKPIFDALSLLHTHNVIHRDVSPDNILIRETGEPVLLDLGAARTVVAGMTQALTTVLKPGYAPIEQYADDGALEQGPWTDVYGLAAVVYFLYTGKAPPQAVTRIVSDSLASDELLAAVPSALRPVLHSALAVLPANRYRTIAEFRSAFVDAIGLETLLTNNPTGPKASDLKTGVAGASIADVSDESTVVRPAVDSFDDSTVVLPTMPRRKGADVPIAVVSRETLPSVEPRQDSKVAAEQRVHDSASTRMKPPFQSTNIGEEHRSSVASKKTKVRKYAALSMASVVAVASLAWIWLERDSNQPVVDVGSTNKTITSPESRPGSPLIVPDETPKSAVAVPVQAAPAIPVASDAPKAIAATATPQNDTTDSVKASSQMPQAVSRPIATAKATAAQSAASVVEPSPRARNLYESGDGVVRPNPSQPVPRPNSIDNVTPARPAANVVDPLPKARNFYETGDGVLRPNVASSVGGSKSLVAQSPSAPSTNATAAAGTDASQVRSASLQPASSAPPVVQESAESLIWKRAMGSRSAFDFMAYLGKFPSGEHANEAQKSLVKAQRSSEGCWLRFPATRAFAWSGKCSEGMAVGSGVLKWTTLQGSAGTVEGRGTFNNGIMVGRWTFDYTYTVPVDNPIVSRVIDFDNAGNVSKQQRYTHKDGAHYVGGTDASMNSYFGARQGEGTFRYAWGQIDRGTYGFNWQYEQKPE